MSIIFENEIKVLEGFRSSPYLDSAGIATIGYGSTYYNDGTPVKMSDPDISRSDAFKLMQVVAQKKWDYVKFALKVKLNDFQVAALLSFIYNVGEGAFLSSTLLKVINKDPENKDAISYEFRKWRFAGKKEIQGLINRREKEISLYFKKKILVPMCC